MVNQCCVPGCRREAKLTVQRFHRFPKDMNLCKLWLVVIKHRLATATEKVNRESVKHLRVCSVHFVPEDYRERSLNNSLKPSAVPSIFSWNLSETSETEVFSEKDATPTPACSEAEEKSWLKDVKDLQTNQETSIFESDEVSVNTQCLLELFQYCGLCKIECYITIEGNEKLFTVTQDCKSCGHQKRWRSHTTPAEEPLEIIRSEHKDRDNAFQTEHKDHKEVIHDEHENEDEALELAGQHSPVSRNGHKEEV